jgi:hypothetical protein
MPRRSSSPSSACGSHSGRILRESARRIRARSLPQPEERLPLVEVHLHNGEVLCVCHVVGLTPRWVALAVREAEETGGAMRTELVPFEVIGRVTIRPVQASRHVAGFSHAGVPPFFSGEIAPEATLAAAARRPSP